MLRNNFGTKNPYIIENSKPLLKEQAIVQRP